MINSIREVYYKYSFVRIVLYPVVFVRRYILKSIQNIKMSVVDNLGKLLCEDPLLNIEGFNGDFVIDKHSHIFKRLVLEGEYEPKLIKYCEMLIDKDRDVIDVGANVGFFTVLFAKSINENQKVLSIEPTSRALKRLRKNIAINKIHDKVILFEGVASNVKGNVEIKTIPGKEEYSSLGSMSHNAITDEEYVLEDVKSLTIDSLVDINEIDPGFIKIDVEGAEHLVFEGAKNVIKKYRPIILSELSDFLLKKNGASSTEVINLIRQFNYTIIDPMHPSASLDTNILGDILCIPNEKISKYKNLRG